MLYIIIGLVLLITARCCGIDTYQLFMLIVGLFLMLLIGVVI